MSQCDTAPSRAGPKASAPREDGAGGGEIVDHDLEGAEMALGRADRALHHREFVDSARRERGGPVIITVTSRCSLSRFAASIACSSRP